MKNIIQEYIFLNIRKIEKIEKTQPLNEGLKVIFDNIASVLLENEICIFLLDERSEIISFFSNEENTNKYSGYQLKIQTDSVEEGFLIEQYKNISLHIAFSSLEKTSVDSSYYRIAVFSANKEKEELEQLSNKIHKAIYNILSQQSKKLENYQQLLSYLDAVDDGISACDENGIVTYVNKSGCSIIGAKKEDLLYKDIKSLLGSDPILAKVIENEQTYMDFEYYINYKNKNIHLINSAFPVYDQNNKIIGAIDIYRRIKRSYKAMANLAGYKASYKFEDFIGSSKALSGAISISKRFSNSNKNVLIIGESGTGKELFAQAMHNYSPRKDGPFVAINCASYPKDLFESELFGYAEGAFTGAKKGGKTGKFEFADGGTLFLDEIGEMSLHLQSKLLRIIETKSLSRIGSNKTIHTDVRIIAATNRNLESMIKDQRFREDLYYRLKVLFLPLPPLRERGEDVIQLCNHFIKISSENSDKKVIGLDEEAAGLLRNYSWPGNIRELENIIALSLFYCEKDYLTKDILIKSGLNVQEETSPIKKNPPKEKLASITKDIILRTLEENKGNKKKTAEQLGVSRNTIYRLLKKD